MKIKPSRTLTITIHAYLLLERYRVVWTTDITYPGSPARYTQIEFQGFEELKGYLLTEESSHPAFSLVAQQAIATAEEAGLPTLTVPQPRDYKSAILDVFKDHPPGAQLSENQLDYEAEELKLWKRLGVRPHFPQET
jgi:hypothetical protein